MGNSQARSLDDDIVLLLKDRDWSVRQTACVTLGQLPADEIVKLKDHIVPLLKDTDWFVRSSACESLRTLPADELAKLKEHIVPLLQDNRKEVRAEVFALFGRLEVTKDLISLVETLRPALLLHFAAAAGDWPACSLLLRSGFSAEEKDSDGRTPSEIAVGKATRIWQGG